MATTFNLGKNTSVDRREVVRPGWVQTCRVDHVHHQRNEANELTVCVFRLLQVQVQFRGTDLIEFLTRRLP